MIGVMVFGALSGGIGIDGQRKGNGARTWSVEAPSIGASEELVVELRRDHDLWSSRMRELFTKDLAVQQCSFALNDMFMKC